MAEGDTVLVRDIMMRPPFTVSPSTVVADAARLMGEKNIGAVVVVDDGRVAGMFTERDLLRRAADLCDQWRSAPVSQVMTRAPVTIAATAGWAEAVEIMDQRRVRHLPVVDKGRLVGILSLRDLVHHRARHLEDLVRDRTRELDEQNAVLSERDRLITRHLEVAARIQRRLLPSGPPEFEPFRFAAAYHAHDQVTGDYYDFMKLGCDRLGLVVADASGHGVPAALVTVMAKTCFNAYCQGIESPAAVLRAMNRHLAGLIEQEHFITMFAATVDRRTRELTYARAGHPLPLVYRAATRDVIAIDAQGMMIGIAGDPTFVEERLQLEPGDRMLFYTDGVSECRNPAGELFGPQLLDDFLRREGERGCGQLLRALEDELDRFRGERPFDDDVTIVVMEVA